MRYKLIVGIFCALALITVFCIDVNASGSTPDNDYIDPFSIGHSTAVDIYDWQFAGLGADFYFKLPEDIEADIREYLTVSRVVYAPGQDILDWYNFECNSFTRLYNPQIIMQFFVFDRSKWRDDLYPYTVILKTDDYVFAAKMGEEDPFLHQEDKLIFSKLYNAFNSISRIKLCIELPAGQKEELSMAVIVNGEVLASPVEVIDGINYIAFREVCDAFGYNITWYDDERKVLVESNGIFIDEFVLDRGTNMTAISPGFNVLLKNDRVFMPTVYYLKVFKKNVEVDSSLNIIITSRP